MAFNRQKMMDEFTERFVDLVCAYRKSGLSNDDLKFMIELFVADQMDKADTEEVAHSTSNNPSSFQLLCEKFVDWCDKEGEFKVDSDFLQLVIDMRSATGKR